MEYNNPTVAQLLINIADAYEIKGKNIFRINSYRYAADSVLTSTQPVFQLWQKGELEQLPYIGPNIFRKLDYWFKTGKFHPQVIRAFKGIHPAVFVLTQVNGIGPQIAHKLTTHLHFPQTNPVKIFDQLIAYAQKGKIHNLPTFGLKSEQLILANTSAFIGRQKMMTYTQAKKIADQVIRYLHQQFPQTEFYPLGSLRRHAPVVGDIDIAAKSSTATVILDYFVKYPRNYQTLAKGPKKASIRIKNDIRIDLMVQNPKTFGSLLQHFTGNREHNIKLRNYALKLGFSLSEYGIKDIHTHQIHTFSKEEDFYRFLKLTYIPPEKRLGQTEITKAEKIFQKL